MKLFIQCFSYLLNSMPVASHLYPVIASLL